MPEKEIELPSFDSVLEVVFMRRRTPTTPERVIRMDVLDKDGKIVAELIPTKPLHQKKVRVVSIQFYDDQERRCTRFLFDPSFKRKSKK